MASDQCDPVSRVLTTGFTKVGVIRCRPLKRPDVFMHDSSGCTIVGAVFDGKNAEMREHLIMLHHGAPVLATKRSTSSHLLPHRKSILLLTRKDRSYNLSAVQRTVEITHRQPQSWTT